MEGRASCGAVALTHHHFIRMDPNLQVSSGSTNGAAGLWERVSSKWIYLEILILLLSELNLLG